MEHLTDKQVQTLKGMGQYWHEVSRRDDQSPLTQELGDVYRMLGTNILWILLDYIETKEAVNELANNLENKNRNVSD